MNKVSLERRRRSYRQHVGPRTFAPVGVARNMQLNYLGIDGSVVKSEVYDHACKCHGVHVCPGIVPALLAPKPEPDLRWAWCSDCESSHLSGDDCATRRKPEPAPSAEPVFVVPAGWERSKAAGAPVWRERGDGLIHQRASIGRRFDGAYNAFRAGDFDSFASFANPYAACLSALGCEVTAFEGHGAWRLRYDGAETFLDGPFASDELPGLVKRLTAERENAGTMERCRAQHEMQRDFPWERTPNWSVCVLGGLRAWFMHGDLVSWDAQANVHQSSGVSLAVLRLADGSRTEAERRAWCEAQMNRIFGEREGDAC